jgi:phage gp36-like protein
MARPVYTTLEQVKAKLPFDFLVEALDDDKDGVLDAEVWTAVAEDAADQVDARLGKRYTVPFDPAALEPIVKSSALIFVLETLYQRRGYGSETDNPYLVSARAARKELNQIGDGDVPLTPVMKRPNRSVAVISEPARTSSASGNLSS